MLSESELKYIFNAARASFAVGKTYADIQREYSIKESHLTQARRVLRVSPQTEGQIIQREVSLHAAYAAARRPGKHPKAYTPPKSNHTCTYTDNMRIERALKVMCNDRLYVPPQRLKHFFARAHKFTLDNQTHT